MPWFFTTFLILVLFNVRVGHAFLLLRAFKMKYCKPLVSHAQLKTTLPGKELGMVNPISTRSSAFRAQKLLPAVCLRHIWFADQACSEAMLN
jgi:hypothetical protein